MSAVVERITSHIGDVGGIPIQRALPSKARRVIGAWCFADHVLDVWTIWRPDYELQAAGKLFTACASVLTAVLGWRLMPKLLAIPSNAEMQAALRSLQQESERRNSAEDHLLELEQSLAGTLASIGAGFITTDDQGRVTRMNAVAEAITGWVAAEARGLSVWQVFDRVDRPAEMLLRNPVDVVAEGGGHAPLCNGRCFRPYAGRAARRRIHQPLRRRGRRFSPCRLDAAAARPTASRKG